MRAAQSGDPELPRAYSTDLRMRVVAAMQAGARRARALPAAVQSGPEPDRARASSGFGTPPPGPKDALWRAVREVLDDIEPEECVNYLGNAGYVSNKAGHALMADFRPNSRRLEAVCIECQDQHLLLHKGRFADRAGRTSPCNPGNSIPNALRDCYRKDPSKYQLYPNLMIL